MRSACTHHQSAPQVIYKKQTCQSNKQGAKPLKMKRRHHQKKEHAVFILCGTYLNCMYNIGRTKKFNFFASYSAYHSVQRSRKKMCYNPCPDFFYDDLRPISLHSIFEFWISELISNLEKNRVQNQLDFFSGLNLISTACVACKNQFQN